MEGKLAYGYKVAPRRGDELIHREIGDKESDGREKMGIFWATVRNAIPLLGSKDDMRLAARRDVKGYDCETLEGYYIVLATKNERLLPSKRRIERLKRHLRTTAEPEWCEIW